MYNEDGTYIEEQPKKKKGCLGFLIVFLILLPFLFVGGIIALVVFIFMSVSAGEPSSQLTMHEFEDIAIENGFDCSLSDDLLLYSMDNEMKAENGDCVIYFLNGGDGLRAQDLIEYDFKDSQSDMPKEGQFEYTSPTFKSFTKSTADTFYYTCGTKDTAMYVMVPMSEIDKAKDLLNDTEYWNEPPAFFDKIEEWLESVGKGMEALEGGKH